MKWDSHISHVFQSKTIVCDVIQKPHVPWRKLTLKNLDQMVNLTCTVRKMKDKGLHCAPEKYAKSLHERLHKDANAYS